MTNKVKITIFSVCLAIVMVAVIYIAFVNKTDKPSVTGQPQEVADTRMTSQEALALALAEAKRWHQDATVSRFESLGAGTSEQGRSDDWNFLFVATARPGKGYQVAIRRRLVSDKTELPFIGEGSIMPPGLIASNEAIARARQIGGYENATVEAVEMIYDATAGKWFWGIKTNKGTVSILAQ